MLAFFSKPLHRAKLRVGGGEGKGLRDANFESNLVWPGWRGGL